MKNAHVSTCPDSMPFRSGVTLPSVRQGAAALLAFVLVMLSSSRAQVSTNLYYDANGGTAGIGGTGNWTTTGAFWTTNPLGTSATVSGGWTNGFAWSNNLANKAILQGTAGTVSLSSTTIYANQIQVNTSGFTIQNSSTGNTGNNRYFRTREGIVLTDGVNLNVSSGVTTNGAITGFEGPIVGANGTNAVSTGSSITVVGATANADSSIRLALDTSASDIWVPVNVNTTGSGYALFSISSSSVTASIYGNVTVSNGSRLVLGGNNSSTTRRINVRGNLTTANTDLVIGEVGGGGTIGLYGTNSIGGNVVLQSGSLGYGSSTAFGSSTVIISNGTSFGQITGIGATDQDRTVSNNISLRGNATLGLGGYGNYLAGNVDLNGGERTIVVGNSTYLSGSITNGSLVVSNASATRTIGLNGSNSITALTQNGGVISVGHDNGLGSATLAVVSNAVGNTLAATSGRSISNNISLAAGVALSMDSGSSNAPTANWSHSGTISGAGSITKTGVGTLVLAGANSYSAGTTVAAGTLRLNNASALGTGAVSVNDGVLDLNSYSLTNPFNISGGSVANGSVNSAAINATAGTLAASVGGASSVSKTGTGTLLINSANTYNGGTTVSAGTLTVNNTSGSGTGSGALTVAGGATLNGTGTIGGATTISGRHEPGNSPGIQTFSADLNYLTGATLSWELVANSSSLRGTEFDGVDVSGGILSIAAGVTSSLVFNGAGSAVDWNNSFWSGNQSWKVFGNTNAPSLASANTFDTINISVDAFGNNLTTVRSGAGFTWSSIGNDVYLNYAIPEPSTYALFGLGAALLAGRRIRRRIRSRD